MKVNKSLTHAANGIHAANMIHKLGNAKYNESNMALNPSSASTIIEMFRVLTDYAPDYHKALLGQATETSKRYLDAYKGLKEHYRSNSRKAFRKEDLITTLKIIKPVLGSNRTDMVEKIIKIYEILYQGT